VITKYPTGLDYRFEPFFYEKGIVLSKFQIIRSGFCEHFENCLNDVFETINRDTKWHGDVLFFEASAWEADSRISRHLAGARTSAFLGKNFEDAECLYQSSVCLNGMVCFYGLSKISMSALIQRGAWLFGLSRAILLFGDVFNEKLDLLCHDLFFAILGEKTSVLSRSSIPKLLGVLENSSLFGVMVGFGDEDFGGYCLDAFLRINNE